MVGGIAQEINARYLLNSEFHCSLPKTLFIIIYAFVCILYSLLYDFNRSEVLRIERELEEARQRLVVIRQAKYKAKGDDSSPTELLENDSSFEHQLNGSR